MIKKLPHAEFLETFERVPRLAINLLIENQHGEVLLTKRNIPPGERLWHYPGGFLLKGETIRACLERIARTELAIELPEVIELAGVFENMDADPRGHIVDVIYRVKLRGEMKLDTTEETREMRFFSELPGGIGFNHGEVLKQLGYK